MGMSVSNTFSKIDCKKILHIPNFYPPHIGGIEDLCCNIVKIVKNHTNIEQKVICFSETKETKYDTYEGVDIIRVGVITKIANQSVSIYYKKILTKIMKEFRPNIIHFHTPNPLVAFLLLSVLPKNTKLIVHWHSDIIAQKYLYYLVKGIESKLLLRANTIIATSPNYIESSNPLKKVKGKTTIIPSAIDVQKFEITQTVKDRIESIKANYTCPIVLFVGRHVAYKGLEYLIKAESQIIEKCVLLIGGIGKQTNYLKSINNSKRIFFLGRISDELLSAYYYAADIFVFPSITKNEAFGLALVEAMYCSTPAITFTIQGSGVNWVNINGETGVEIENKNITELSNAINILLKNQALREEYARNAKKRIEENFTINKIKDIILELYKDEDINE